MKAISWQIDRHSGQLTVEGLTASEARALAGDLLPPPSQVNCARPLPAQLAAVSPARSGDDGAQPILRVIRLYHGSVVDGPGRRSVVQVAGCPHFCTGCFAP